MEDQCSHLSVGANRVSNLQLRTMDLLGSILTKENAASRKNKRSGPLRSIFVVVAREKNDRGTDRSVEYNPIGVASGRFTQATGASIKMSQFLFVFLAVSVDGFWVEPYRIEVTHSSVRAPLTGR